eukprot:2835490-Pleurochrysis_carterae.AAC.1
MCKSLTITCGDQALAPFDGRCTVRPSPLHPSVITAAPFGRHRCTLRHMQSRLPVLLALVLQLAVAIADDQLLIY